MIMFILSARLSATDCEEQYTVTATRLQYKTKVDCTRLQYKTVVQDCSTRLSTLQYKTAVQKESEYKTEYR
jgi:hypothetical protein